MSRADAGGAGDVPGGGGETVPPSPQPGLRDAARDYVSRIRGGDVGPLPAILGLVALLIVFSSLRPETFTNSFNFANLLIQSAPVIVIAMGLVFVLLIGEIDLSAGFTAGVSGAMLGVVATRNEMPWYLGVLVCITTGAVIGLLIGLLVARVGIPSFVVTLAGLLAWNGVVLLLIGSKGTVILQNDFIIGIANNFLPDSTAWILALVTIALYAAVLLTRQRSRKAAGIEIDPTLIVALRIASLAVALGLIVYVANQDRGVPYAGIVVAALFVFWTFVLNRTKFGRHIYAVGGNAEAARRAGINVDNVRIACFAIVSLMAVIGGIILASRLRSVDTNTGGGQALLYPIAAAVIGGTSLFGGRGTMKAALLGAIVMISIDNGLGLLGLSSGTKFVVTGGVLLLAVTVDSISRRGRAQSGRA